MAIGLQHISAHVADAVAKAAEKREAQPDEDFAGIVGALVAASLGLVTWVVAVLMAISILG